MSYRCSVCGEIHTDLPDIAFEMPLYAHQIPESERDQRVELTSDTCIVDGEDFFWVPNSSAYKDIGRQSLPYEDTTTRRPRRHAL